jgi:hypothetical protein
MASNGITARNVTQAIVGIVGTKRISLSSIKKVLVKIRIIKIRRTLMKPQTWRLMMLVLVRFFSMAKIDHYANT